MAESYQQYEARMGRQGYTPQQFGPWYDSVPYTAPEARGAPTTLTIQPPGALPAPARGWQTDTALAAHQRAAAAPSAGKTLRAAGLYAPGTSSVLSAQERAGLLNATRGPGTSSVLSAQERAGLLSQVAPRAAPSLETIAVQNVAAAENRDARFSAAAGRPGALAERAQARAAPRADPFAGLTIGPSVMRSAPGPGQDLRLGISDQDQMIALAATNPDFAPGGKYNPGGDLNDRSLSSIAETANALNATDTLTDADRNDLGWVSESAPPAPPGPFDRGGREHDPYGVEGLISPYEAPGWTGGVYTGVTGARSGWDRGKGPPAGWARAIGGLLGTMNPGYQEAAHRAGRGESFESIMEAAVKGWAMGPTTLIGLPFAMESMIMGSKFGPRTDYNRGYFEGPTGPPGSIGLGLNQTLSSGNPAMGLASNDYPGLFGMGTVGSTMHSVTRGMYDSVGPKGGQYGYGFGVQPGGGFGSLTGYDYAGYKSEQDPAGGWTESYRGRYGPEALEAAMAADLQEGLEMEGPPGRTGTYETRPGFVGRTDKGDLPYTSEGAALGEGPDGGDDGCFLTTAACEILEKSDNCDELNAFRKVRDELWGKWYIQHLIKKYYRLAPAKANQLRVHPRRQQIAATMFQKYVPRVMKALKNDQTWRAILIYISMSRFVKRELAREI